MSYRCDECETVCNHRELRAVTETREVSYPHVTRKGDVYRHSHGIEIVRETKFCPDCARAAGFPELADALRAYEMGVGGEGRTVVMDTFGNASKPSDVKLLEFRPVDGSSFAITAEEHQVV